ncbi:MAG: siderophore-interacting protein [Salinibacterium sp.]|nr:siderophore-interacting protein [Salinibacterium sp.]
MLTLPAELELTRDSRAAYRPYRASVVSITEISPSFRRVTFTGPHFEHFAPHGLDQRIKLVFPSSSAEVADIGADDEVAQREGSWYSLWRDLPDHRRSPIRTFTVRGVRPSARQLDVDFVVHGDGGPAAHWLSGASIGDEIVIVGPDARSESSALGIDWRPGSARALLLAGDATAAPAICSILESLPEGTRARAFIEVPTIDDVLAVRSRAHIEVTWVTADLGESVRDWTASNSASFASALALTGQAIPEIDIDTEMLWESPKESSGNFYAWLAGESALIKDLRRLLVSELGIDRSRVAFMGYWRRGRSELQG